MGYTSSNEVLTEARMTLETARFGLDDFLHSDTEARRTAGLRNVIVWGRSVTNVLQNLRSVIEKQAFDSWYEPKQIEMRAEPTFKYIYELRSQILKEGTHGQTTGGVHIRSMNQWDIVKAPKPPGAGGYFMGDALGGSGWIIRRPDGTDEKYYAALPATVDAATWANFASKTTEKGLEPPDDTIEAMFKKYLSYLSSLVEEATEVFGQRENKH
jgi:hypothetical protein